ncbi:DUF2235 domain-containing protein [Albidovulum sediminis]|uniref:DUF2235 domain-containing protein n=1 Tax=Albidovulum sediminis TaxID=3066345 RepID=A0ABT2NG96_9RHOB|nr:DUF2235 domain-containing protein [Defluviimonas sediminis]MCT8327942.1 DUF2235 domain-containing protein [Defluviimonas sediminis]
MGRNIAIFSDGTGQRGGVHFDERRSNIYKLYRAARCGPDSSVDPCEQFAYYDPGIGTVPPGIGFVGALLRRVENLVCQATGLGLTANIIDCYAEIVRNWQPGDRIYLFGFSRGAYTVRCLAAVLSFCGVPTRMKDGSPLLRDPDTCRKIATEAVTKVYQHVGSPRDTKYLPQRQALARRFREDYDSGTSDRSNAIPHFIGVFDTVASLASIGSLFVVVVVWLALAGLFGGVIGVGVGNAWLGGAAFIGVSIVMALAFYVKTHLKVAFNLPGIPWWKTLHFTALRMTFYDTQLNINVGWARHALAIDECRKDFDRVPWGTPNEWRKVGNGEPGWFKQLWFAGNHSDIGGSYPEPESRLSDISLAWMLDEATGVPDGLKVDRTVLQLYPSPAGMQHDETRGWVFRYAGKINRSIVHEAPLHPSVIERFGEANVLQHDIAKPYRPTGLQQHQKVKSFYDRSVADHNC